MRGVGAGWNFKRLTRAACSRIWGALIACFAALAPALAATPPYDPPLSAYADLSKLPVGDLVGPGEGETRESLLSRIRVKGFNYAEINESGVDIGAVVTGSIVIVPATDGTSGLALKVPGVDAFELVTGIGEISYSVTLREAESTDAAKNYPVIIEITGIDLGLRLKGEFLRPAELQTDGSYKVFTFDEAKGHFVDGATPVFTEFSTTADVVVRYTWDGEVEAEFVTGSGPAKFNASRPFMIAETGVVVDVRGASLDLSTTSSPASAPNAAWRGLTLDELSVAFTGDLAIDPMDSDQSANPPELGNVALSKFAIGTGGFSGEIAAANLGAGAPADLGGIDFKLQKIGVVFQQNALTAAELGGRFDSFPFFEKPLKLDLAFDLKGNFTAGIAADDPSRDASTELVSWDIDGAAKLAVDSIEFELADKVFYTTINGDLTLSFLGGGSGVNAQSPQDEKIPINNLRISSTGEVTLDGGWVTLAQKRYLDFNAFRVELSQIGFGLEGTERWVGFSGGVELVKGLSAAAKMKRLQFIWQKGGNGNVRHRLEGVEVAFEQPGVVSFHGAVDWFEDSAKKGFGGKLAANLEFIEMAVSSRIVIGEASGAVVPAAGGTCEPPISGSAFKYFYLDLEASLPAGIPIFSNVSIYGFSGLLGVQVEPNLCAFDRPLDWFKAHLTASNPFDGSPPPWSPRDDAVAVGIGAMIGTTADNGFTINTKVAVSVKVPGPVVIFSGQGFIIKKRGELLDAAEPLFMALAVYDGNRPSFLLNLGIYYKIPDSGDVIDLAAESEAFFNLTDPSDWHLYLGKDTPESQRIQATIFKLFPASAYHMIDPKGFRFGASVSYSSLPDWKVGPLRISLAAWMGFDAALAWRPVHVWGSANLGGLADVSAFGFGVGLSANAILAMSTPTPFYIDGQFNVEMKLPWPLPDPKATVRLRWEKQADPEPVDQLVPRFGLEASREPLAIAATAMHGVTVAAGHSIPRSTLCAPWESLPTMPDGAPPPSCIGRPMAPVTYRPIVAFERSTNQALTASQPQLVGNVNGHSDTVGNASIRYDLTSLKLWATPLTTGPDLTFSDVLPEVYGVWPTYLGNPGRPAALSVKLWNKNPFSIYDASTFISYDNQGTGETWSDWVAGLYGDWPCPPKDEKPAETSPYAVGNLRLNVAAVFGVFGKEGGRRCFDPTILNQKDLILPPYHAFALAVESNAAVSGASTSKQYRDVGYFYTQGGPLALDSFVDHTMPASLNFRLYRSYRVGLRFNETYLDLLYKEPGSPTELLYKDPAQKAVFEIVDENGDPAVDQDQNPVMVSTDWAEAVDHVDTRNDGALLDLLTSKGIQSGVQPTDDMVYGWPAYADALRPGARYSARLWFQDKRLPTDGRIADPIWLAANPVRKIDGDKVLLFEYPFIASQFERFSDIAAAYEGSWFPTATSSWDGAAVAAAANAARDRATKPAFVMNSSAKFIGWSLAHGRPDLSPDTASSTIMADALRRTPGYQDDIFRLSDTEIAAIKAEWQEELQSFDATSAAIGIDRTIEPLPQKLEISVIEDGGVNRAFLFELPGEGVEWPRIVPRLEFRASSSGAWTTVQSSAVADRRGERFFLFRRNGGALQAFADGEYRITLIYNRNIGSRAPVYVRTDPVTGAEDGQLNEAAVFTLRIPQDMAVPESGL